MLEKSTLEKTFKLNPPTIPEAIALAQTHIPMALPAAYKNLMLVANGLYASGNLAIHELEAMTQRNIDHQVFEYMPGYFMIGDDGGGQAIVVNENGEVFEVGMGTMSEDDLEKSADSIDLLLTLHAGKTLNER